MSSNCDIPTVHRSFRCKPARLVMPDETEEQIRNHFEGTSYHRYAEALVLRKQGLKLSEVGSLLGVSKERARQMILKAIRLLKKDLPNDAFLRFPERAKNCFKAEGYQDTESVKKGIINGAIHPKFAPNYGPATHKEVLSCLGIIGEFPVPNPNTVAAYTHYLERHGYLVAKIDQGEGR